MIRSARRAIVLPFLCLALLAGDPKPAGDGHDSPSRLTDEVIPLQVDSVPERLKPLIELGAPFLGSGPIKPGIQLPTGAVWQPGLIVFGSLRTAIQHNGYSPTLGDASITEGVARLDLFADLRLSGSERLVVGFRNLDRDGRFTGEVFDSENPAVEEGSRDELNAELGTLFFEGDIGEIFPNLSPRDFSPTDIGFAVGRQPIFFQEGMLINDTIDGVGLTWNSLQPRKSSNLRATFFYGWNNVNRSGDPQDGGRLIGLFTSMDTPRSTIDLDLVYHAAEEAAADLAAFGLSAVQRIGLLNTSFRVLGSHIDDGLDATNGYLFFSELSLTPHHTHDLLYLNSFYALDTFTPAATGAGAGGALGRAGISFAGVGLGNYGAPLNPNAANVYGAAVGYQLFFDHNRDQIIFELAGRVGTEDLVDDQFGATIRYQAALGRRYVVVVDGFANRVETFDDTFFGGRLEFQAQF